jgi:YfiH family protein
VRRREWPLDDAGYVRRGSLEEADGQATADPRVSALVLVADCLPLVIAAPGEVAVAHCGWRGVAAGIVPEGVTAVCDAAGEGAAEATAALGPGIGPCCYEVGAEVAAAFEARGLGEALTAGWRLDLAAAIRAELERVGVPPGAIHATGLCTSCHPELFFSHRRDGARTGRQAGLAWLRAG